VKRTAEQGKPSGPGRPAGAVRPRSVHQHNVARLDRRGRLGVRLKSAERSYEHANGHRRKFP
jgi:hypothetical protein